MKRLRLNYLLMLTATLLTACTFNPVTMYKDTGQATEDVKAKITTLGDRGYQEDTPDLRYTSTTAVLPPARWLAQPKWMNDRISMRGQNMPFSFWNNKVLGSSGVAISYQDGMNPNVTLPFNYTGTIRGALDKLAQTTGYSYTVDCSGVSWVSFVTKTFDVSFMPGASQYMMGGQTSIGNVSSGSISEGGTNGSAGGASTNVSAQMQAGQFSSLQATLSVWTDLENTIKTMLSKDGQVTVSQATTTITVRDRPQNVRVIADYLASMNKDLSRQVALQVEVLQIKLNKAFSYGIDWNLVTNNILLKGGLQPDPANPGRTLTTLGGDLTSLGGISPTNIGFGIMKDNNPKMLINALAQQGDVSTVTNPRVVTLNNQVAQIAITTQKTYLASSSVTQTANVGSQVSLTPGTVTTGFTLYVLPKIINHDVFLQLTSELSSLDSLTTFSSQVAQQASTTGGSSSTTAGTGSNSSSSSSSNNNTNATPGITSIEEPTVSSKSFNQRVMVPSNYTLVLSGFRQVDNQNIKSAPFALQLAGNLAAQQDTTEILVLITPIIVGDNG